MLLPHGYEGQGPEHSSARLERYLQLCAQGNLQVCNLTNPAQLFHVFRRQMKRDFRKPLIIMSPKSLLRHPKVVCRLEDLAQGAFREVLDDEQLEDKKKVRRVIFCSGKLYYDIDKEREARGGLSNIAILRVEQLYPFPEKLILKILKKYPAVEEVIWAQEEPRNMGACQFISNRLASLVREVWEGVPLRYIGRSERASPATGSSHVHAQEQEAIVRDCLRIEERRSKGS
jgi:2-oxoglutarate dehydrogenase E1 component